MSQIRVCVLLAAIQVICCCILSSPSFAADADLRSPVPNAAALATATRVAREAFSADLKAAKSPAEKSAVARKILQTAEDSKAVAADRYVLLDLARTTAASAPDADTAFLALDRMKATFTIDAVDLGQDTVTTLASSSSAFDDRFFAGAEGVLSEAVQADRFKEANAIAKSGLAAAKKSRSASMARHWTDLFAKVDAMRAAYEKIPPALKILESKPDDPAANLTVGTYLSFEKGQWPKGLPLLAAGNDLELRDLARRDLAGATDAAAQVALADAWWDLGEKRGAMAAQIRGRAAFWYRQAAPGLAGLVRLKVEHRIKEFETNPDPLAAGEEAGAAKGWSSHMSGATYRWSNGKLVRFQTDRRVFVDDHDSGTWTTEDQIMVIRWMDKGKFREEERLKITDDGQELVSDVYGRHHRVN